MIAFTLASQHQRRYGSPVTVNPVAGFGDPFRQRRTGAINSIAGAFFVPAASRYGGCARDTFGYAGFLCPRSVNLRTAAT